jgi:hypothetical protein
MNSTTSKVAPPREWLSLKQLQRYSHLSEKIIQGWIRQPANPLPVTRMGKISLVRRSTFDRWVASEYPLVAELIAHLRKKPARASLLSTSSLYRALYTDQPLCHEAMPWLDHRRRRPLGRVVSGGMACCGYSNAPTLSRNSSG